MTVTGGVISQLLMSDISNYYDIYVQIYPVFIYLMIRRLAGLLTETTLSSQDSNENSNTLITDQNKTACIFSY